MTETTTQDRSTVDLDALADHLAELQADFPAPPATHGACVPVEVLERLLTAVRGMRDEADTPSKRWWDLNYVVESLRSSIAVANALGNRQSTPVRGEGL